jgi:2-polyprenyl-6-methoxyphenol hydroxylase-like FAD-dependent oxidoreductase
VRTHDMRSVFIVGAGPAGLYCATLLKRARPQLRVTVAEQNPAGATFGFGVVFSDTALDFLKKDDAETHDLIAPHMQTWRDMTLVHRGERVVIDGVGFSAIGRLELLAILEQRAAAAGVDVRHDRAIGRLDEIEADLIVGADGLNSLVRRSHEGDFRTSLSYFDNKFVWYAATRPFDTLTQTFVDSQWGPFNAHHYRYAPGRSTFIVECERATWLAAGFAELDEAAAKERCAAIFADTLGGAELVSNRSLWRNFPVLWNERWSHRNRVLIGDALHTAHFSIGSGTRLAMEDAIALATALARDTSLEAALEDYEAERKPIVRKLADAANHSAAWYETFGTRMALDPLDFGYDYITRSGRVDRDRLRAIAPGFAARYDAQRLHSGKETSR